MAKAKKGKQRQDTQPPNQPPAQPPLIPTNVPKEPEAPPKEPAKEIEDEPSLMEMPGSILDDGWPTPAKANPDPWTNNALPADGWGNANHAAAQAMKPATTNSSKEKQGATNKAATGWDGGWGQDDHGSGAAGNGGWGAGGKDGWGAGGGVNKGWGNEDDWEEEEWDEEDEEDEEDLHGWGEHTNSSAWPVRAPSAAQQPGWRGWSEEAKRLPKPAASAATGARANRTALSPQQQSQILNSLLSQPQTQNPYVAYAQQQQKQRQAANPYPPQPALHAQGGNIWSSLIGAKQPQAQPHHRPGKEEEKHSKKERERSQQKNSGKHQRSQPENFDGWGWGMQDTGGHDSFGWGAIPEEDEEDEYDDRRVHFSPRRATLGAWSVNSSKPAAPSIWGSELSKSSVTPKLSSSEKAIDTSYTMPSKTLAHAYNGTTTTLNTGIPRNKINEYTNVQFNESKGSALKPVQQALFGRARKAKDRIHWMFPSDKDERVETLLTWIQSVSYSLGTYGLHRFLQSRERGALLANADFRLPGSPGEPAFDWLTFDQLRETRDKILQESAAFYDPTKEVVVFVFLPSKSGNSVAMWRRRINVPNNMRLMLQGEISLALAGLRREKDYVVYVDEYPVKPASARRASVPPYPDYSTAYPIMVEEEGVGQPAKKKKKRKWWHFFKINW